MWPIEKRCQQRDTSAFVVAETVDLLADKLVGIIGDRRMTKMHRYLGDHGGTPRLFAGQRPDHRANGGPVNRREGQSVTVYLASQARGLESVGIGIGLHESETEEQVRHRYHHPEEQWLGQRRDITLVQLDGWPGSPCRDDQIRIEYWNEHGVGQETILVFDDVDHIEEIAWHAKGDPERRVYMWDEFCDAHGLHFEHPDHRAGACKGRQPTLAENLAVLAEIARRRGGAS